MHIFACAQSFCLTMSFVMLLPALVVMESQVKLLNLSAFSLAMILITFADMIVLLLLSSAKRCTLLNSTTEKCAIEYLSANVIFARQPGYWF